MCCVVLPSCSYLCVGGVQEEERKMLVEHADAKIFVQEKLCRSEQQNESLRRQVSVSMTHPLALSHWSVLCAVCVS